MDFLKLTNDGFYVLLFLCPGYLGFRVYLIDRSWNSINVLHVFYGSLVFSVFAYLAFEASAYAVSPYITVPQKAGHFFYALFATPFGVALGLLWRSYGHKWFHNVLNRMKVTNEDNDSTPWMQLFNNTKIRLSQITVYMKDGSALRCDQTHFFDNKQLRDLGLYSHYTCIDGDVFFIANMIKAKDADTWEEIPNIHVGQPWGIRVQWIPAREIARVEARAIDSSLPAEEVTS